MLLKLRATLAEQASKAVIKEFAESRTRILDRLLKAAGVEVPANPLDPAKPVNNRSAEALSEPKSTKKPGDLKPVIAPAVDRPVKLVATHALNKSALVRNTGDQVQSGKQYSREAKARRQRSSLRQPASKLAAQESREIARQPNPGKPALRAQPPQLAYRSPPKQPSRLDDANSHSVKEQEDSTQVSAHHRQLEERLDYILNILLCQKIVDIKRKYFDIDLIDSAVAFEELDGLIRLIEEGLAEVEDGQDQFQNV